MAGVIITGFMLIGVRTLLPTQAATSYDTAASSNTTNGLLGMLPNIQKIYRESLLMPFQKAASQIHDKDIAEYYQQLLNASGLNAPIDPSANTTGR